MSTANALINTAFIIAGVRANGETPTAAESQDGLRMLNWVIEGLLIMGLGNFTEALPTIALIPSVNQITMGPSGDIVGERPISLLDVWAVYGSGQNAVSYPMQRLDERGWDNITAKNTTAQIPLAFYYEPAYPNGIIYLYPVPTTASTILHVRYKKALDQFSSLSANVAYPPGYEECLTYLLAARIIQEYGVPDTNNITLRSEQLKLQLASNNMRPALMLFDNRMPRGRNRGNRWNIITNN